MSIIAVRIKAELIISIIRLRLKITASENIILPANNDDIQTTGNIINKSNVIKSKTYKKTTQKKKRQNDLQI
jgi:hypothetical protein